MKGFHRIVVSLPLLVVSGAAFAQEVFRDEMNSGAGWGVNATSADHQVTFAYDYSSDGIPEAPHFRAGDSVTTGVKLEANLELGAASVLTLYPVGENFMGNYQVRFDAWINYDVNDAVNGASIGTTEFIGGGLGYDDASADIGVGAQILASGDGGSGSDWRAFADGAFLDPAEMAAGSRNGSDPYYSNFLPGVVPPMAQSQDAFPAGRDGSPGFQWITFEIRTMDGEAFMTIEKPGGERLLIAQFNGDGLRPFTSDGNIGLVYADLFSSVSPRPELTFGVIDNVEVVEFPETAPPPIPPPPPPPTSSMAVPVPALHPLGLTLLALLLGLGGMGLARRRVG